MELLLKIIETMAISLVKILLDELVKYLKKRFKNDKNTPTT